MRVQSKKSNKALFPSAIAITFFLSLVYWLYLSLTTRMDIACDAIEYESLGRMIATHGWVSYFTTGPHREPLYPLLVALSMNIGDLAGIYYTKIMAIFGLLILFLTQVSLYAILRLLNIRNSIIILILSYFALSPSLNNAAFSLYSEVLAFPFVLAIILTSIYAEKAIKEINERSSWIYGMLLGLSATLATLVKGVFEGIIPIYIIIFFSIIFLLNKEKIIKKTTPFILCLLAALIFFYAPITSFKWLNKQYNGSFVLTNRGSWLLYGNTARRMEPLTPRKFAEALATVPGEGVCNSLFGHKNCAFWSFLKSDDLWHIKMAEISQYHLSDSQTNALLIHLSIQKASQNPFQYALMTILEGSKMFFWESTQVGFVDYPHWLQKIYDTKIFNNCLRLMISLLTLIAVLRLWTNTTITQQSLFKFLIGVIIFLYISFYAFFVVENRYCLPIAPLYLIAIGIWLEEILSAKKIN